MTTFKLEPVCSYPGHSDLADHPPCFQGEAAQAEAQAGDPALRITCYDLMMLAPEVEADRAFNEQDDQQDDQPDWAKAWQEQAEANRADPDFGQGNGPIVWAG